MSLGNAGIDGIPNPGTSSLFAYQHTAVNLYSVSGWTSAPLNEYTLYTCTIPGGAMGLNGSLEVIALWTYTSGANNKTTKGKFSSTLYMNVNRTTTGCAKTHMLISNRNSVSSQIGNNAANTDFGTSPGALGVSSIDTSQAQDITLTGQTSLETGFTPTGANCSGTGTVVTIVYTSHGLNSGEYIKAAGSSTGGYNVDPVQITKIDANTFTYAGTGSGTPGTAPTIQRYSVLQLEDVIVRILR